MKKLLFLACIFAGMLVSCSSDDGMINSDNGIDSSEGKKENGDATIFVNFTLQDESGIEKYVFKEGENIIFRLDIVNNTDEQVYMNNPDRMFFDNDIFHVYSSKGEDVGLPFDIWIILESKYTSIPAYNSMSYICPWWNEPDSPWRQGYSDFIIEKIRPLPKGDYYSEFKVRLDKYKVNENKIVTCKKSFKIE